MYLEQYLVQQSGCPVSARIIDLVSFFEKCFLDKDVLFSLKFSED